MAQLLATLERRELSLRQRFEAIYEKATDTRNLLDRVDFTAATDAADENTSATAEAASAESSTESGASDSAARRAMARRQLRIAGSLQNVAQSANEILGIAEAFDDMYEQLVNNRIDNPDLKGRLHDQIAEPLQRIGKIRMPQWEAELQLVQQHLDDPAAAAPRWRSRSSWPIRSWSRCIRCSTACWNWKRITKCSPCCARSSTTRNRSTARRESGRKKSLRICLKTNRLHRAT